MMLLNMGVFDWLMIAVLLLSTLVGMVRGLIFEVLSLLAWIASFFLAQRWAGDVAALLPTEDWNPSLRYGAGFVLVFVVALFGCSFVTWLIRKMVQSIGLRPADRSLGAIFGLLRGVVALMVFAVLVTSTRLVEAPWWRESVLAPTVMLLVHQAQPVLQHEWMDHRPW